MHFSASRPLLIYSIASLTAPVRRRAPPVQSKFRMGVFTSASKKTVRVAVAMLEEAAGEGPPVFDPRLILHRVHTQPVEQVRMLCAGTVRFLGSSACKLKYRNCCCRASMLQTAGELQLRMCIAAVTH